MFNVTVIKLRDIIKFIIIIIVLYFFSKFILENLTIKDNFNQSISLNTNDFLTMAINKESSIIKNVSKEEEKNNIEKTEEVEDDFSEMALKSILQIGMVSFGAEEEETELKKDKPLEVAVNTDNSNDANSQNDSQKILTDVQTKVITAHPIAENYNREYGNGVKIKNETSYELTDNMLNSNDLEINQNNILIFHTHTCESYTQSDNYKYEAVRKL